MHATRTPLQVWFWAAGCCPAHRSIPNLKA
jgi:hypothetical protein